MLRATRDEIPLLGREGSYALLTGFPDPATGAPTMIRNQTIISGSVYQNGAQIDTSNNPNYVRQAHGRARVYPFLPSTQVFPVTTVAVVPNTDDVPYAQACGNGTTWPSNLSRLSASAVPNEPICTSPPESISIEEFLKRAARHRVKKSLPASLSLLL
jgi:hypothetical protein